MFIPIPPIGIAIAATYGLSKSGKLPKINIKRRKISRPNISIKRKSFRVSGQINPLNKLLNNILSPVKRVEKQDLKTLAYNLLPEGAALINPRFPQNTKGYLLADLDGDSKNELIQAYILDKQIFISIFKQQDQEWLKAAEITSSDYKDINFLNFADMNNDGAKELLVGWQNEHGTNDLNIYKLSGQEMKNLGEYKYNRLELIENPNEKGLPSTELALWTFESDGMYDIELIVWNGSQLSSKDNSSLYYSRNVVPYYLSKVKQMPYEADNWYCLADACIKANLPHYATEAVDTGLAFISEPSQKEKLISLKQTRTTPFF